MTVIGQDIPMERPDVDGRAALFVPSVNAKEEVLVTIRKGAAVVGFSNHDRTITVYFEANRFDDPALFKWENKARKAYDRMTQNAPTVSKMSTSYDNFEQIGYINGKSLTIRRMASLERWLGMSDMLDTIPESETVARTITQPKVDIVKV